MMTTMILISIVTTLAMTLIILAALISKGRLKKKELEFSILGLTPGSQANPGGQVGKKFVRGYSQVQYL